MWRSARWRASLSLVVILLVDLCTSLWASASSAVLNEIEIRPRGSTRVHMPHRAAASSTSGWYKRLAHHDAIGTFRRPRRKRYYERKILKRGEDCTDSAAMNSSRPSQSHGRIPKVLVLTGKNESFDSLPEDTKVNIQRILQEDPTMKMRWLGDKACSSYIQEHYDKELLDFFNAEPHGSRRGDLCRTAVLLREGGFYLDLDVVLAVPLRDLVDDDTSFMSAYEDPDRVDAGLLNAIIAAEPGSTVLSRTLEVLRKWYRGEVDYVDSAGQYHWMGPATLMFGLLSTMDTDCPCEDLDKRRTKLNEPGAANQWRCGPHSVRLYAQKELRCRHSHRDPGDPFECSEKRARLKFVGAHYGLFEPGTHRKLIGWCRPESCTHEGCDLGGWDETASFTQNSQKEHDSDETKRFLRREE